MVTNLRRTRLAGWFEYSRETCPICQKSGGCMINEDGKVVVCIREKSKVVFSKTFQSWVHHLEEKKTVNTEMLGKQVKSHKKVASNLLDFVYRNLLEVTKLNGEHYNHLTDVSRGMIQSEIINRGYRSFPTKPWETVKKVTERTGYQKFSGVPGFYSNEYGWSLSGGQGILIPYRNQMNEIVGFQIRVDSPKNDVEIDRGTMEYFECRVSKQPNTVQAFVNGEKVLEKEMAVGQTEVIEYEGEKASVKLVKGQRYFWLSSANRENGTGAGDPSPVHVAVPSEQLKEWENSTLLKTDSVWYTEGALKADIASEHIQKLLSEDKFEGIGTAILGTTVIATPGVNTWRTIMPVLKEMEVKHVNIAIDMDVMTNEHVEFYLKELAKELKEEGYTANIAIWNQADGKGIDDVLVNKRIPQLRKLF